MPKGTIGCHCLECQLKGLRQAFGNDISAEVLVNKWGAMICKARLLNLDEYDDDAAEEAHHVPQANASTAVFRPPGVG